MSFTIEGFSKEQYESYLNSPLNTVVWKSNHWVGHFNLARYPILVIFINRLAYFLLHGEYLDNVALFNKFKTYDFTSIETKEHYQIALDLFKKFQACQEIDKIELELTNEDLKEHKEFGDNKTGKKTNAKSPDKSLQKKEGGDKENLQGQQHAKGNPLIQASPGATDVQKGSPQKQDGAGKDKTAPNATEGVVDVAHAPVVVIPQVGPIKPETPNIVLEPIPVNIQAIIDHPFPLSNLESIQDLYQNLNMPANRARLSLYRKNLFILRDFERKLRKENKQTDADFAKYMQKIDQAHERAWKQAIEDAPALHTAFLEENKKPKQVFDSNGVSKGWDYAEEKPVKFKENGEIVCTFKQFEWVKDQISKKYRAIYDLSIDVPSLEIHQERRMVRLIQLILGGAAAQNQPIPQSYQFIRLEETETLSNPVVNYKSTDNSPFTKWGSYIFTQFIGKDRLESLQQKLEHLSESFVEYWLQKKGTTLKLPGVTIQSGPAAEGAKAADWVEHVRNTYTQYLKGLNPNQLKELIDNTFHCPFVQTVIQACEDQIDPVDSLTSHFPKSMIERILKRELQKAQGNDSLKQAIQKTIDQSAFADPKDIEILSKTSGYLPSYIEPLIRIRVLYLMSCLGDTAVNSVVDGVKQRAAAFYDPVVCDDPKKEPSLLCNCHNDKVLELDKSLDQLDMKVVTILEDPIYDHPIGQVESTFHISSIHQKNSDTTFVEMQKPALNIHASKTQSDFLLSQFSPEIVFSNLSALTEEIENLSIVKNAKAYQQAKRAAKESWTSLMKSFNSTPYSQWDHDKSELVRLCRKAQLYVSYLSTQKILEDKKQLEIFQNTAKQNFDAQAEKIRVDLKSVYQLFHDLYSKEMMGENAHAKKCKSYLQKLGHLYSTTSDDWVASTTDGDKKTPENDSENSLNVGEKGAIEQSQKFIPEDIQYFEELIDGMKKNILAYIEKEEFPEIEPGGKPKIDRMIEMGEKKQSQWLEALFPIMKFCKKIPNIKPDRFNEDYLDEVCNAWREGFVLELRKAAKWAKEHPTVSGVHHIDAVCYLFYTRYLSADTKAPHLAQWDTGMTSFDPNMQSHPPHVLFDTIIKKKGDDKQVFHHIGMGSPTIETSKGGIEINDEFLGYLRTCKRNKKAHLYINHQNFIPNLQLGKDESVCCQVLHDLADNEFKDTLFVITLSHNSPFYKQQGHNFDTLHASTIKKQIVADLLDGSSRAFKNFIPEQLKTNGELREWLDKTMENKCPTLLDGNINFASEKIRDDFVEVLHKDLQIYLHKLLKTNPSPEGKKERLGYTLYDHSPSKFKNELVEQVFNHNRHVTGNHIPEDMVVKFGLRKWSKDAVNQIHQTLFKGSTKLTVEERRIFVRLFYINLSWKILMETKVNYCNRSFKEWLDWSVATAAEENAYQSIANKWVKDLSPLKKSLEPMTETVKFMLENQKGIQKLQTTLFPLIKITRKF